MDIAYGFSRALNGAQIAARLVGVALALRDTDLSIVGDVDATKKLVFQVDTQATASIVTINVGAQTASRTFNLPVVAGTDTLAALGIAQTFTGAQTFSATLTLADAVNIPVGTTTGTKIGTATTQKLGFFNATPVVQQTGDVATALTNLGLVTSPTIRATDALDGTFFVKNTADTTKQFKWSLSGNTTGIALTLATAQSTAQTLNVPNITGTDTLSVLGLAQTYSGAKTFSATLTLADAVNIPVGTTTGTKIGTATTQKLGFFNATPVVQQTGDVATALTNLGLVTSPTIRATDALDGTFFVKNTADTTKQFKWSLSGNTTGIALTLATAQSTAQTLNVPNITGTDTIATLGLAQTISGAKTFSAITTVSNATTSSSPSTGAFVVVGGVGIGGTMVIGGNLTSQAVCGAVNGFEVQGTSGGFVAGKLYAGASLGTILTGKTGSTNDFTLTDPSGNVVLNVPTGTKNVVLASTTASSSTTTGALQVPGGAGFAGAVNAGGDVSAIVSATRFVKISANTASPTEIRLDDNSAVQAFKLNNAGTTGINQGMAVNVGLGDSGTIRASWNLFTAITEGTWSATAGTQNGSVTLQSIASGSAVEFLRGNSAGATILGGDPGGTDRLRVNGALTINSATMIQTKTSFTNGAAAAAGTLTNAPVAGNPTKWIPINDNGTTRYIPAW